MRILIAGCGSISGNWISGASGGDDARIAALADISPGRAEQAARKFSLKEAVIFSDLGRALDETRPDIVFNCTPPEAHFRTTALCMESGSHVFSEKPMAASMEEAGELCAISRRTGKVLAVMQNRRFHAGAAALRKLILEGSAGFPVSIDSDFYLGSWFRGFRRSMEHVLLLDMAVHTFDAARFLTGAEPVSVFCREWNPRDSWFSHGASAAAVFEMTGGLVYSYRGSWTAPGMNTSWQSSWRVTGTAGTILWDGEDTVKAEILRKIPPGEGDTRLFEVNAAMGTPCPVPGHRGAILNFLDCIKKGSLPPTHCGDNIKTLAMVFGAIESAAKGKTVNIRGG